MKRILTTVMCILILLSAAAPAAAQSRKTTGIVSLLAGAGLVIAAFDYETDICPEGYSRHTYQHQPTQCVYVSPDWPFTRTSATRRPKRRSRAPSSPGQASAPSASAPCF